MKIQKNPLNCENGEVQRAFNFIQMIDRELNLDPNAVVKTVISKVLNKLSMDDVSDEGAKTKTMDISEAGLAMFLQCLLNVR